MSSIFEDEENNPWTMVQVSNENFWQNHDIWRSEHLFVIKDQVLEWLEQKVGPRATMRQIGDWRVALPISLLITHLYFRDREKALLFKLTWG